jgi:hypothetical protein
VRDDIADDEEVAVLPDPCDLPPRSNISG